MFGLKAKRAQVENDFKARSELGEVLRNVIAILKTAPTGSTISRVRITFHKDPSSGRVAMNPISFESAGGPSAVPEASSARLDQALILKIKSTKLETAVRVYAQKYSRLREHDEILIAATEIIFTDRHAHIPI